MTELISLPIVAGGVGAAEPTNSLSAKKTILVTGLAGRINVEASNDGGTTWCQIASFAGATEDQIVLVAAEMMRVDSSSGSASSVQVVAERSLVRSGVLPAAPADGPGAALDVSEFGCMTTVSVGDFSGKGAVNVEISGDGVEWATAYSFKANGCQHKDISARFIRANGNGATASISVGSEDPGAVANSAPIGDYVWRPGATGDDAPGGNVYVGVGEEGFQELYDALQSTQFQGPRVLWFDSQFSPDSIPGGATVFGPTCLIPAGTWDMKDVEWRSREKEGPELQEVNVSFEDQAFCPNLARIELTGNLWHAGLHSPLSSVFTAGQIGRVIFVQESGLPLVKLTTDVGVNPTFQLYTGCQFQPGSSGIPFLTPSVSPVPMIDVGDEFCFVQGFGVLMPDNIFMASGTGSIGFVGSGSAYSGRHDWDQPGLVNGYFVNLLTAGGYFPQHLAGIVDDFTAWLSRRWLVDTSAGAIDAQALDSFSMGQWFSISDETGDCGKNPVNVIDPVGGGTVQAPFLTRPFQTKTWMSDDAGNWLCVYDSHEEFVTGVIAAATTAVNNATNLVDSSGGAFALAFPLAAEARKGAIIRVVSDGSGGANAVTATASGGDAIVGVATVSNLEFKTYQSDGVATWFRIA